MVTLLTGQTLKQLQVKNILHNGKGTGCSLNTGHTVQVLVHVQYRQQTEYKCDKADACLIYF